MKKTIVSTNWLNKVIAIMMMMSITFAMPAMAGNNKKNDKKHDVEKDCALRCPQDQSLSS